VPAKSSFITATCLLLAALLYASSSEMAVTNALGLRNLHSTRLLVIAPHPDDESLAAAGLIQRVHDAGGVVRVVVMTSGDALIQGVELADHTTNPTATEFRRYGHRRERETTSAMAGLGLDPSHLTFLGFPDDGLCLLASRYQSARSVSLQSPYTHRSGPPAAEQMIHGVSYRGYDVRRELQRVLLEFRPTVIVMPDAGDEHPDHCSTEIFVQEALHSLANSVGTRPRLLHYLVHYSQWPLDFGTTGALRMTPPSTFPDAGRWRSLTLTARESERKRLAILGYESQTRIMRDFMLAFARNTELYLEGDAPVTAECWCNGEAVATSVPRTASRRKSSSAPARR
jgi:LmbE family N-acetylglucosaminyl deacetylase